MPIFWQYWSTVIIVIKKSIKSFIQWNKQSDSSWTQRGKGYNYRWFQHGPQCNSSIGVVIRTGGLEAHGLHSTMIGFLARILDARIVFATTDGAGSKLTTQLESRSTTSKRSSTASVLVLHALPSYRKFGFIFLYISISITQMLCSHRWLSKDSERLLNNCSETLVLNTLTIQL